MNSHQIVDLVVLAVLLYCTGEIEQDGFMAILAFLCILLTIVLYGILIFIAYKFGVAAMNHLFWG